MSRQSQLDQDLRGMEGAPDAAAHSEWKDDRARADWTALVSRIRRGDELAADEFKGTYGPGSNLLFRRRLGAIRADQVVEQALAGAVEEIRRGWINHPRDLVQFLRMVIQREEAKTTGEPVAGALLGMSDKVRIRGKARQIERALRSMTAEERAALNRYYIDGQGDNKRASLLRLTVFSKY